MVRRRRVFVRRPKKKLDLPNFPATRRNLRRTSNGYKVTSCADGFDALQVFDLKRLIFCSSTTACQA